MHGARGTRQRTPLAWMTTDRVPSFFLDGHSDHTGRPPAPSVRASILEKPWIAKLHLGRGGVMRTLWPLLYLAASRVASCNNAIAESSVHEIMKN